MYQVTSVIARNVSSVHQRLHVMFQMHISVYT